MSEGVALEIVSKTSPYSVKETMDKLEAIVKEKGLGVFGRVNHQQNAESVDLEMGGAEVLIFGNPIIGTQLMQQDIAVALDLPMKVAIYQGDDGQTRVAYRSPLIWAETFDLAGHPALDKIAMALDGLTTAAIQ